MVVLAAEQCVKLGYILCCLKSSTKIGGRFNPSYLKGVWDHQFSAIFCKVWENMHKCPLLKASQSRRQKPSFMSNFVINIFSSDKGMQRHG